MIKRKKKRKELAQKEYNEKETRKPLNYFTDYFLKGGIHELGISWDRMQWDRM